MKKIYTCPMHPEIEQETPGTCPKCGGMKLVLKEEQKSSLRNYLPLIIISSLLLVTTLTLSYRDSMNGMFAFSTTVSYFMIGFFLVFSGFKLMDLKGFAEGYSTYDILAKRWYTYGYIYPFIELFFGLGMIVFTEARWLLLIELLIMAFSGLGVAIKLVKKETFQCACLGTFLKVPLTKVTLIEDFGMAALALLMLLIT